VKDKKENWRILTNKEVYAVVKKTHHSRDNEATQNTDYIGLGMYREWKKINSQKCIVNESGINKTKR
jgi:hypothetical protein